MLLHHVLIGFYAASAAIGAGASISVARRLARRSAAGRRWVYGWIVTTFGCLAGLAGLIIAFVISRFDGTCPDPFGKYRPLTRCGVWQFAAENVVLWMLFGVPAFGLVLVVVPITFLTVWFMHWQSGRRGRLVPPPASPSSPPI